MKKRKKLAEKSEDSSIFSIILLIILLFLKIIGDFIIFLGILILRFSTNSYKSLQLSFSKTVSSFYERIVLLKRQGKIVLRKAFLSLQRIMNNSLQKFKTFIRRAKQKLLRINYKKYLSFSRASTPGHSQQRKSWMNIPHIKFPKVSRFIPGLPMLPLSVQIFLLKLRYFLFGAAVLGIAVIVYQLNLFVRSLPNPSYLTTHDFATTTKIYDRNGKLLYQIYADENRTPMKLADIPKNMIDATIATEDKDFYSHQGFSVQGITRAFLHNINSDNLEGGSTITQQLIRSAFLTPRKTIDRKLRELILAVWAERIYTKDQILEMYFNQVPYGGTAWGIEAAAQNYFGKSVRNISLAEAALLAGLPAAPSRYSPFGPYPQFAKIRQKEVLDRMVENKYISEDEAKKANEEKLSFKTQNEAIAAPHFVMWVKQLLEEKYGSLAVSTGGLRVTTTLDLDLQEKAQAALTRQIESLQGLSVGNGAALITNPQTGEILAMIGSRDYFDTENDGNVNVTLSLRQPGSSIKVVTYAAALQNGFTAASIIDDVPTSFNIPGQPAYIPVNYDGRFHGKVSFRVALASSYNIPAVKILSKIGVKTMVDLGKKMGITSWEDESRYGLSLTLGGGEVTMLDMSKVYGTLATGGIRHDLTPFLKVTNLKGEVMPLPNEKPPARALTETATYIMSHILSDNTARTPAFGPSSALVIPGKTVAVKTGTSDNKRDNWTIGYTPDHVVAVWVGNNDNTPMHPQLTSGVTGAAPIWQEIMKMLLEGEKSVPFNKPDGIVTISCNGRTEYFIAGTEPKGRCFFSPQPSISFPEQRT